MNTERLQQLKERQKLYRRNYILRHRLPLYGPTHYVSKQGEGMEYSAAGYFFKPEDKRKYEGEFRLDLYKQYKKEKHAWLGIKNLNN